MTNVAGQSGGRLSARDLETLNRQIMVAARAGAPLVPALKSLSRDLGGGRLRASVERLAADMESGVSVSEAFARQPDAFPPLYAAMLRAAEVSGNLYGVMDMLSHLVTTAAGLRRKLAAATVYPVIVLVAALGILAFVSVVVVPPMLRLSSAIKTGYGMEKLVVLETVAGIVVLGLALAVVVLLVVLLAPARGAAFGRSIPLIGPIMRAQGVFVFARTFAVLLRAGVPMREALAVVREVMTDARSKAGVDRVLAGLHSGATLGDAMETVALDGTFPESLAWLVQTAEARGDLPGGLDEAADHYRDECDGRARFVMEILPPFMIVGVGVAVALVIIPLFLPLVELIRMMGSSAGGMD